MPAAGAYVGLAPPGNAGSWQRENKVFSLENHVRLSVLLKLRLYFLSSNQVLIVVAFSNSTRAINFGQQSTKVAHLPLATYVLVTITFMLGCLDLLETISMMLQSAYHQASNNLNEL